MFVPYLKALGEDWFCGAGEREGERSELLAGLQLWSSRQISRHDRHLMEVTHLNRNPAEHLKMGSSAIYNHRLNGKPLLLECFQALLIDRRGFSLRDSPNEILLEVRRSQDTDAEVPSIKRHVSDQNNRLW